MALNNNITMTHSGMIGDKETGKHYVLVRFERPDEGGRPKKVVIGESGEKSDVPGKNHEIEIKLPFCEVIVNNGFSSDEVEELKEYLKEHEKEIMEKARSISSFLHIFG